MSERCSPEAIEKILWNRNDRLACMAGADAIHLLSQEYLHSLPTFLQERTSAIPNPAEPPVSVDWNRKSVARKRLLAVGRLDERQKQFSLLLRAFALLATDFPDWDCCICGGGPNREMYSKLVKDLHLSSRVTLPGMVDDVDTFYATSHLFCMPSRFEGFPNALLEAQRHGLPGVGFAKCGGVNEIIVSGENGILAQDMNAADLAKSLRPLMSNASLRRSMGEKGQALLSRYQDEKIYDKWEILLAKASESKNRTRLNIPLFSERERLEFSLREIISRSHPLVDPRYPEVLLQRRSSVITMLRSRLK
jgi:glycosyltransferase involved in cell wall biosynthesis